jgi:cytochrome c
MSSFEWNKVIGSVLAALIVAMVGGILASKFVSPEKLEKPVFAIATPKQPEATAAKAPAGPPPIATLLAQADPKRGEQTAQVCTACHTFQKGEPNKIGPNLWNIAGGEIAEDRGGFQFSSALAAKKGQKWTPELLDRWLENPQAFAKGTKMTFAGISDPKKRADVVAFVETLTPGGLAAEKELAEKLAKSAPAAKPAGAAPAAAKPAGPPPIEARLAKADAKKGQEEAQICTACHSFEKGGPNKIGPNLFGVVGAPIGEDRGGYAFSSGMETKKGQKWTPELLDQWLKDPPAFIKGTKMTFAGIKSDKQRADIIAYLQTLK